MDELSAVNPRLSGRLDGHFAKRKQCSQVRYKNRNILCSVLLGMSAIPPSSPTRTLERKNALIHRLAARDSASRLPLLHGM